MPSCVSRESPVRKLGKARSVPTSERSLASGCCAGRSEWRSCLDVPDHLRHRMLRRVEIIMCTGSPTRWPSSIWLSFCRANRRNSSPKCCRSGPCTTFRPYSGMEEEALRFRNRENSTASPAEPGDSGWRLVSRVRNTPAFGPRFGPMAALRSIAVARGHVSLARLATATGQVGVG